MPDATGTPPRDGPATTMSGKDVAAAATLSARYRAVAAKVPLLRAIQDRGEHATGSNEFVVSGRLTRDGRPILANDPHLGLGNPSIFYPIHLQAPGLDVAGEGFAGTPGLAQGANRDIAWGSTTNPMDVTDTYLEQIRPDPAVAQRARHRLRGTAGAGAGDPGDVPGQQRRPGRRWSRRATGSRPRR